MKVEITIKSATNIVIHATSEGATYRATSMSDAIAKSCVLAQECTLSPSMVFNNDSAITHVNRLVELKLNEFIAALLEAVESQPRKCQGIVIRPSLKVSLELADRDSRNFGLIHDTADSAAQTSQGQAGTHPHTPNQTA